MWENDSKLVNLVPNLTNLPYNPSFSQELTSNTLVHQKQLNTVQLQNQTPPPSPPQTHLPLYIVCIIINWLTKHHYRLGKYFLPTNIYLKIKFDVMTKIVITKSKERVKKNLTPIQNKRLPMQNHQGREGGSERYLCLTG